MTQILFFIEAAARDAGVYLEAPRHGDAGLDLRAADDLLIPANEQGVVSTGLRVAIPLGWVGFVKDRSSMASKRIYSHGGVIDAGYRGEIKLLLSNQGKEPYVITKGDKVAQLVVIPCLTAVQGVESLEELGDTDRGAEGFGSTGKR